MLSSCHHSSAVWQMKSKQVPAAIWHAAPSGDSRWYCWLVCNVTRPVKPSFLYCIRHDRTLAAVAAVADKERRWKSLIWSAEWYHLVSQIMQRHRRAGREKTSVRFCLSWSETIWSHRAYHRRAGIGGRDLQTLRLVPMLGGLGYLPCGGTLFVIFTVKWFGAPAITCLRLLPR